MCGDAACENNSVDLRAGVLLILWNFMFRIQCACMIGWKARCICTMLHVLVSKVYGDWGIWTIAKILYIYYCQFSIVLKVWIFSLPTSHKVLIFIYHVLHADIVVWCFIGQLDSYIRLKVVKVSVPDFWRWLSWWLHILLIRKMPLDMQHQFMAHNSEVVKFPFNVRCDMRQMSCMHYVDTSVTRWEIFIWLVDMNFHTSLIQDSICSHCWVSM